MKTIIIIHNRNVGFFSVFLQIVNTLIYIDDDKNIIPIINNMEPKIVNINR